ncbi:hypothetical protein [Streptomyces chromofuscus]|uniref:hypothetical protein n=1 Tax=Streptomyces chromofuscus TaxID=42881 RepID=UPI002AD4C061|nr:hypothetical protein [Streptomyces chromofuscus]
MHGAVRDSAALAGLRPGVKALGTDISVPPAGLPSGAGRSHPSDSVTPHVILGRSRPTLGLKRLKFRTLRTWQ